jgi:hypothetical protein
LLDLHAGHAGLGWDDRLERLAVCACETACIVLGELAPLARLPCLALLILGAVEPEVANELAPMLARPGQAGPLGRHAPEEILVAEHGHVRVPVDQRPVGDLGEHAHDRVDGAVELILGESGNAHLPRETSDLVAQREGDLLGLAARVRAELAILAARSDLPPQAVRRADQGQAQSLQLALQGSRCGDDQEVELAASRADFDVRQDESVDAALIKIPAELAEELLLCRVAQRVAEEDLYVFVCHLCRADPAATLRFVSPI